MHAQAQAAPVAAADATGAGAGAAAGADANPKPDQLRYGAHTDYQGFTILSQDVRLILPGGFLIRVIDSLDHTGALPVDCGTWYKDWVVAPCAREKIEQSSTTVF